MTRLVAINILLFLVPFFGYVGWLLIRNGRIRATDWPVRVVVALIIAGAVVFLIGLAILPSFSGAEPSEPYRPAEIRDGQVVPGGFGNE